MPDNDYPESWGWPSPPREDKPVDSLETQPFHYPPPKNKIWLNLILFLVTILTTMFAGALQQGVNPLNNPYEITKGIPFSFALLIILLSHELGHYLMSRRHGVKVTLPYFIPAPSFIGTFGAFIKMQSPIQNRQTLLDVGAAGPLAGVVISLPFLIVGLKLSEVRAAMPIEGGTMLGSSLLLSFLTRIILGSLPDNYNVIIHPLGFAGWIGLLVTSLNLIPVGQLDGGHIAYAIWGNRQEKVSVTTLFALVGLGFFGWPGWFTWAILLMVLGVRHPPPLDQWTPLDKKRKIIGWLSLVIFILTFTPVPFGTL